MFRRAVSGAVLSMAWRSAVAERSNSVNEKYFI